MNEPDRQLVELIRETTEYSLVQYLEDVLQGYGRDRAKRLIADEFAVVRRRGGSLDDGTFLPADEAFVVIDHLRSTDEYVFMAAPWAPVDPEDEPDLVGRYAADEPDAIAEVRRVNAERRARLCP